MEGSFEWEKERADVLILCIGWRWSISWFCFGWRLRDAKALTSFRYRDVRIAASCREYNIGLQVTRPIITESKSQLLQLKRSVKHMFIYSP